MYYTCKKTGREWSPIIAQKKILPGEEIFTPYGTEVKWVNLSSKHSMETDDDKKNRIRMMKARVVTIVSMKMEGIERKIVRRNQNQMMMILEMRIGPRPIQVQLETSPKEEKPLVNEVLDKEWASLKKASTRHEEKTEDQKAYAAKYDDLCESITRRLPTRSCLNARVIRLQQDIRLKEPRIS